MNHFSIRMTSNSMRKPFLMSFTTNPFWRFTNITLKHLDTVTDSRRRSLISCYQHNTDGLHRKWRNLSHSGIHSCSRHTQFEKKCLNLTKVTTFCNYIPLNEENFSKCNIRLIKVLKYWKPDFHDWLIVCYSLFVWVVFFSLDTFSLIYGDVTITGEWLQFFTYTRYSWSLSSESSLTCLTYCDTGNPFMMVISEDPWHSHCCGAFSNRVLTTCFNDLRLSRLIFEHPTFPIRGERSR